jgi:hypothetical protein
VFFHKNRKKHKNFHYLVLQNVNEPLILEQVRSINGFLNKKFKSLLKFVAQPQKQRSLLKKRPLFCVRIINYFL